MIEARLVPVVILVRPQMAENVGMAARAMANFGLSDLRLVAPREGWDLRGEGAKGAVQAAVGAAPILERARVFATLEAAAADLVALYATTARERGQAKPVLAPDAAMADVAAYGAAGGACGVVFGPERTGLENDEISLCNAVVTFPVDPAFASLNLAQAVLLMAYEWSRAAGQAVPFSLPNHSGPAQRATLFSFFRFVEGELDRVRFFHPPARRAVMVRNFRNIVHRMAPTEQDIRTLRGAILALIRGGSAARTPQNDADATQSGDQG